MLLYNKTKEAIEKYAMLKQGACVLIGVSGGPDSVAMLFLLKELSESMQLKLVVVHLNHELRGKESDRDEAYVAGLARRLSIPSVTSRIDVKAFSRSKKISMEDAARRVRYDFFLKTARQMGIDAIATAHTKDDQAETVLMRILRGTGLRGLRGIAPVSKVGNVTLIRPFISVSRKDVESYLKAKKIRAVVDSSNSDCTFYRNKLRNGLIPLIKKEYSPRITELLSNLTEVLDKDYEYLTGQQDKAFRKLAKLRNIDRVEFPLKPFEREHISMQRGLIRKALKVLAGSLKGIDYRHLKELEALVEVRPAGSVVHLPGGYEAVKTDATLIIRPHQIKKACRHLIRPVALKMHGLTNFNGKKMSVRTVKKRPSFNRYPKAVEYFDVKKRDLPLTLRLRKPGDKMRPLGMDGYKKLKNIFIDEKIPLNHRDKTPLVETANNEIIWICGVKRAHKGRILPSSRNIFRLELLSR